MIGQVSLLVTRVMLVARIATPPPSTKRGRGRPQCYTARLFWKALSILIVRHLHTVHELLSVLAQPPTERQGLRALLTQAGR